MPRTLSPDDLHDPRHRLGLLGEAEAIRYFREAGWALEAHRFRVGHNDLDLVMRQGALVAFVEVKTRQGQGFGSGVEAIGWRKRRVLARLAEVWRLRHGRAGDGYRFDVVEVRWARAMGPVVVHLPDAWRIW